MIKAIKEDKLVFTVEQQQYLQGYLPINLLILYNKYGLISHDDILNVWLLWTRATWQLSKNMVAKLQITANQSTEETLDTSNVSLSFSFMGRKGRDSLESKYEAS